MPSVLDIRPAELRFARPLMGEGVPPEKILCAELRDIEAGRCPLPPGSAVWVVCSLGPRAALAARYLRAAGVQARAYPGGEAALREALQRGEVLPLE